MVKCLSFLGDLTLIKMLFSDLNLLPFSSSARYIAFKLVATEISCSYLLLNMRLLLPAQMLDIMKDPSVAPQV